MQFTFVTAFASILKNWNLFIQNEFKLLYYKFSSYRCITKSTHGISIYNRIKILFFLIVYVNLIVLQKIENIVFHLGLGKHRTR